MVLLSSYSTQDGTSRSRITWFVASTTTIDQIGSESTLLLLEDPSYDGILPFIVLTVFSSMPDGLSREKTWKVV